MVQEIHKLQKIASHLEPNESTRNDLNRKAIEYANRYLKELVHLPAYAHDNPTDIIPNNFDHPIQMERALEIVYNAIDTIGINPASHGHLGYIPGGGLYTSSLADFLADISNKYAGLHYASPGAVRMENGLLEWTKRLIGYPDSALGNLCSGGSIANLTAIVTARDVHGIKGERITKSAIYVSQQTHHCVQKALRIAGLEDIQIRYVSCNATYKMDAEDLTNKVEADIQAGINPFMVVASCGSTDTGAADPLKIIGHIAQQNQMWFHIDAAYGGYFILCEELSQNFEGIEMSNSIVMDPHKTLFLPYGSGIVLIKDGNQLYQSFHYSAGYLQDIVEDNSNVSPADLSPELTKHFRGLRMWLPLALHGQKPFSAALYEKHLLTKYFWHKVQQIGFDVGPEPNFSVAIYRYTKHIDDPNDFNARLVRLVQDDGRIFISSTTIDGIFWIRIAIVCFRTHLSTIDLYLDILKDKVKELVIATD